MSLTSSQTRAIEITERVTSTFSLLGVSIIITTFLCDNGFRKPINRLVFYAAWGNILSNIATIISVTGVTAGQSSPLCQFQSFFIQWFLPADALWSFCMALNVYLTFVHKYDAQHIRSLEWMYFLLCYGLPFIPGFVFFFIHTESRGKVYGSAVLWCWISVEWDYLRIAMFYGPVWFVIFSTLIIYVLCGRIIFKWRRQLLNFAPPELSSSHDTPIVRTKQTEVFFEMSPKSDQADLPRYTVEIAAGHPGEHKTVAFSEEESMYPNGRRFTSHVTNQQRIANASNRAAINYCRVALLFFVALCITWIPSTINRVYSLVYPESVSFPLAFASALVLPLQGSWNTVIYVATSLPACKKCVRRIWSPSTPGENNQSKHGRMLMEGVANISRNPSRARTTESEEELRRDGNWDKS